MKRIIIIEDQEFPLDALESAVKEVFPNQNYDVAKWYAQAEELIATNNYDICLLDHRMPLDNPGCTDSDFDRFTAQLENIGYYLIPTIRARNPDAVIIGTSSTTACERGSVPVPDYTIHKDYNTAPTELRSIVEKTKHGNFKK